MLVDQVKAKNGLACSSNQLLVACWPDHGSMNLDLYDDSGRGVDL